MWQYPNIKVVGIAEGAKVKGTINNLTVAAVSYQFNDEKRDIQYWNNVLKQRTEFVIIVDKLTISEFKSLAASLENNQLLTELTISRQETNGFKYIFDALKNNQCLQVLDIRDNNLGDEDCKYISETLKVTNSLRELYMQFNNISDDGCKYLHEALRCNSSLEILDLSDNKISNSWQKLLILSLKNGSLKELTIDNDDD